MGIGNLVQKWINTWREYPIAIIAYDCRRWEGQYYEYWLGYLIKEFLFFKSFPDKGPTHIQYNSPFGFLLQWPLCFHFWYQFKPQQMNSEGYRLPGTEKVFYFRIGFVRWDSGDGKYVSGWDISLFGLHFNTLFGTFYCGLRWD